MFDARTFLEDQGINYQTEGKNISANWIGINCPFCNDPSEHGGFSLEKGYYNCFRCGAHKLIDIIIELIGCSQSKAKSILTKYSTDKPIPFATKPPAVLWLPGDCDPMKEQHKQYLESRNFDPDKLEKEWAVQGTGIIGPYKHRIVAPIFHRGRAVSYQTRAIHKNQYPKYKACQRQLEIIHHKTILYGSDKVRTNSVIIVEGITDVWRLGIGAVATFGIEFTQAQVLFIAKNYQRVFVCFDREEQAAKQGKKLTEQLIGIGIEAKFIWTPTNDPAAMTVSDAAHFKKELNLQSLGLGL